MTKPKDERQFSKKRLMIYFILAYLVAALILLLAIVPIQYGFDPLGLGKAFGLNKIAQQREAGMVTRGGAVEPGHAHLQGAPFKTETITLQIEDLGEIEYKFVMPEKAVFVYSWKVEGEPLNGGVYFDFHGHPPTDNGGKFPEGYFKSYATGEQPQQSGGFVAPFEGYHGWFFQNLETGPITVTLAISGYWDRHLELYRSVAGEVKTRVPY